MFFDIACKAQPDGHMSSASTGPEVPSLALRAYSIEGLGNHPGGVPDEKVPSASWTGGAAPVPPFTGSLDTRRDIRPLPRRRKDASSARPPQKSSLKSTDILYVYVMSKV